MARPAGADEPASARERIARHPITTRGRPIMRKTIALAAAAAALSTAVGAATAAGSPAATAATARTAAAHVDARRVRVPNEIGRNHQAAQDDLQVHGFYNLRERDCTGRGRLLLFDRNWKVVRQSPRPGARVSVNRAITLCSGKYSD
jgi:hypothetical protein